MEELDLRNFEKLYTTKLEPALVNLEKERKKSMATFILPIACFITSLLCFFIIPMVCFFIIIPYSHQDAPNISTCIAAFFGVCTLASAMWTYFKITNQKTNIKNKLYKLIFDIIGCKYISNYTIKDQFHYIIKNIFLLLDIMAQQLGIYVNIDDIIQGQYKSLPFYAVDTFINYGQSSKSIAFRGIVLMTKINKPLKCDIIIKSNQLPKVQTLFGNQKIKLESIDFEKMFDVYSNDQIEARYILTPSFMERLIKYKKRKGKSIDVYMSNNITPEANVFFFIPTWKDNFEIPLFEAINNKSIIFNIIRELTDALDIINELKLEQNIGL